MVYLPMSYIYGKKFVGPITPIVLTLRKELYNIPYDDINWDKARNQCAKVYELYTFFVFLIVHGSNSKDIKNNFILQYHSVCCYSVLVTSGRHVCVG